MGQIRDHNSIKYEVLQRFRPIHNNYKLVDQYSIRTGFLGWEIETARIKLDRHGLLTLFVGYTWDGPSGPTIDSKNFIRGSLGHDGKYELMRLGLLPSRSRWLADYELRQDCLKDGMSRVRAFWVFWGVNLFASFAARAKTLIKGVL